MADGARFLDARLVVIWLKTTVQFMGLYLRQFAISKLVSFQARLAAQSRNENSLRGAPYCTSGTPRRIAATRAGETAWGETAPRGLVSLFPQKLLKTITRDVIGLSGGEGREEGFARAMYCDALIRSVTCCAGTFLPRRHPSCFY